MLEVKDNLFQLQLHGGTGGFNGGANGGTGNASPNYRGYGGSGGGGSSDIRIKEDSLYARIIVAGGGGGTYGYNTYGCGTETNGGPGGGLNGIAGGTGDSSWSNPGGAGTQTAAGAGGTKPTHTSSGSDSSYGGSGGGRRWRRLVWRPEVVALELQMVQVEIMHMQEMQETMA